jgi:hypothetical protein
MSAKLTEDSLTPAEGYAKFRGRCKAMSEALVAADPTLRLVRGHYYDAAWGGDQGHWWCVDTADKIIDPTAAQFPSNGTGIYTEFDGYIDCTGCGKEIHEDDIHAAFGSRVYCSYECYGADVM